MNRTISDLRPLAANADPIGTWTGPEASLRQDLDGIHEILHEPNSSAFAIQTPAGIALTNEGTATIVDGPSGKDNLLAYVPPCPAQSLGDPAFKADHNLQYAYAAGAMANGIASVDLVEAMAREGFLAFFGSAGLSIERDTDAVLDLKRRLKKETFGVNLIHSPNESDLENALVNLLLRENVHLVEASAFLRLTLPVVRYRLHGISQDAQGNIVTPNNIVAKVSRVEVATRFLSPPPEDMVLALVESGDLTEHQAALATRVPVAGDLTAEADSGGHTDNRPAVALLPTMMALRDRLQSEFNYAKPIRVGLAGGVSTPTSAAAAFAMGAAYVLTGSLNQSCIEAGTSDLVRVMLAEAEQADIAMCPAADMFEMGVQVQVLKRGTMFAMRASKLYEYYRRCKSLDDIPPAERDKLEKTVFRASFEDVWSQTEQFFAVRAPRQIERADKDPRHKMALVFRWYLGQSSNWANAGIADRKMDYQVWCGSAMGAFNEWVRGTYLEDPANRSAPTIAKEIMRGAAILQRINALRTQNIQVAPELTAIRPKLHEPALVRESA